MVREAAGGTASLQGLADRGAKAVMEEAERGREGPHDEEEVRDGEGQREEKGSTLRKERAFPEKWHDVKPLNLHSPLRK